MAIPARGQATAFPVGYLPGRAAEAGGLVLVRVDLELCSARVVGPRVGLPGGYLGGLSGTFTDLHRRLHDAADAGLLPHLVSDGPGAAQAVELGAGWRHRGALSADRLVLLGETGAVAAVRALAPACPDLAVVDSPDPRAVAAAFSGARRPRLVVLEGPPWVAALAAELGPRARTLTVVRDPSASPCKLDGAELLDAAGAADLRFGAVGAAALALAGWSRCSAVDLDSALSQARAAGSRPGLRDNPAYRLAAVATWLGVVRGQHRPALLLPGAALQPWGAWASRAWAAFSSRSVPGPSGQERRGAWPLVLGLGDEAAVQYLVAGPGDAWVLAVEPREDLGSTGRALLQAQVRQLVDAGRPVVRLGLRRADAAGLLSLSWLWLQAAVVAAALDPVDPLTMDAADGWRERSQAAVGD